MSPNHFVLLQKLANELTPENISDLAFSYGLD